MPRDILTFLVFILGNILLLHFTCETYAKMYFLLKSCISDLLLFLNPLLPLEKINPSEHYLNIDNHLVVN